MDMEEPEVDVEAVRKEVSALSLEALMEKWPDFHGTAVYGRVARLNHACNPNCRVEFSDSAECRILTCRKVPVGEELRISYIRDGLPLAARERELKDYGFVCDCSLCVKERLAKS